MDLDFKEIYAEPEMIPEGWAIAVDQELSGGEGVRTGPFSTYAAAKDWISSDVASQGTLDDDFPDAEDRYWVVLAPASSIQEDPSRHTGPGNVHFS